MPDFGCNAIYFQAIQNLHPHQTVGIEYTTEQIAEQKRRSKLIDQGRCIQCEKPSKTVRCPECMHPKKAKPKPEPK